MSDIKIGITSSAEDAARQIRAMGESAKVAAPQVDALSEANAEMRSILSTLVKSIDAMTEATVAGSKRQVTAQKATAKAAKESSEDISTAAAKAASTGEVLTEQIKLSARAQEFASKFGKQYADILLTTGARVSDLGKEWKAALSPAEKTAAKLAELNAFTSDAEKRTAGYATVVAELGKKLDDQVRRQDTNVGSQHKLSRSLSELTDGIQATIREVGSLNRTTLADFSFQAKKSFGEIKVSIGETIASVGAWNIAAAGAVIGVAAIGVAAVKSAGDFTHHAIEIEKAAKFAGIATESLSRYQIMARKVGLELGEVGEIFAELASRQRDVEGGNKDLIAAFGLLGITTADLSGKLADPQARLLAIADGFANADDKARATDAIMQIFGDGLAKKLAPALADGSAGLREMTEQNDRLGLSMSQSGVEAARAYNDTLIELNGTVSGFTTTIGQFAAEVAVANLKMFDVKAALTYYGILGEASAEPTKMIAANLAKVQNAANAVNIEIGRLEGISMFGRTPEMDAELKGLREKRNLYAEQLRLLQGQKAVQSADGVSPVKVAEQTTKAIKAQVPAYREVAVEMAQVHTDWRKFMVDAPAMVYDVESSVKALSMAADDDPFSKWATSADRFSSAASDIGRGLGDLVSFWGDATSAELADTTAKITSLEQSLSTTTDKLEQKRLNGKLKALKAQERAELEAARRVFFIQRGLGLTSVVIDTAGAIMKALNSIGGPTNPYNIAAAAAAALAGGVQAATILSTKPPSMSGGGSSAASFSAPSTSQSAASRAVSTDTGTAKGTTAGADTGTLTTSGRYAVPLTDGYLPPTSGAQMLKLSPGDSANVKRAGAVSRDDGKQAGLLAEIVSELKRQSRQLSDLSAQLLRKQHFASVASPAGMR